MSFAAPQNSSATAPALGHRFRQIVPDLREPRPINLRYVCFAGNERQQDFFFRNDGSVDFVGWVERSETHQTPAFVGDGFRFALPILRRYDFAISPHELPEAC
jgi:hypothetical protein